MKKYIILNNNEKLTKKQIVQICHESGIMTYKISTFWNRLKWFTNKMETIIMKKKEWETLEAYLTTTKIKSYKTTNKKGKTTSISFIHKGNKYLDGFETY